MVMEDQGKGDGCFRRSGCESRASAKGQYLQELPTSEGMCPDSMKTHTVVKDIWYVWKDG